MPFKVDTELEEIRQQIYDVVWPLVSVSDTGSSFWKLADGKSADETGVVYKGNHPQLGVIWKLHVNVDISADEYYQRFIHRGEYVGWVPSLCAYEVLERGQLGDYDWGVYYTKTGQIVKIVSSRIFVNLYFHNKLPDGSHLVVFTGTEHADSPSSLDSVRGEYLPSVALLRPVSDNPTRCELHFVDNADLKGLLPKTLKNFVMSSYLLEFAAAAIKKTKSISNGN